MLELTGSKSKLVFEPLPEDDPKQRQPDIDKARAKLGWEPKIALRDGLVKTIEYFDDLLRSNYLPPRSAPVAALVLLRHELLWQAIFAGRIALQHGH